MTRRLFALLALLLLALLFAAPSGSAPPFSPAALPGLSVWLRGKSIHQPAGSNVALWPDESGLGNDATQALAVQQPLFVTSPERAVSGDGIDDLLELSAACGADLAGGGSTFVVSRAAPVPAGFDYGELCSNFALPRGSYLDAWAWSTGAGDLHLEVDAGNTTGDQRYTWGLTNVADSVPHLLEIDYDGTNLAWTLDGNNDQAPGSSILLGYTCEASTEPFGLLGVENFGRLPARVPEVIVCRTPGGLSSTDRTATRAYLKAKYGTP
jgi:hypothetical protein